MSDDFDAANQEEYAARALERAQKNARMRGFTRTALSRRSLEESRGDTTEESGEFYAQNDDASLDVAAVNVDDPNGDLTALTQISRSARSQWVTSSGLAPMRTAYRSVKPLGNIIDTMVRRNEWDTPTKMGSIMAKWATIVGPDVAQHCTVETFEDHRLIVRCSSTAWAKQLQLLLPSIERRIVEEVGAGVVSQVIIRGPVAPGWKKGPLSVPGRGPRDTYG